VGAYQLGQDLTNSNNSLEHALKKDQSFDSTREWLYADGLYFTISHYNILIDELLRRFENKI